jgi:dihydropyrimidinase
MKILIKNGTIVTAGDMVKADVLIDGEKIALIGQDLAGYEKEADETIDAAGKLLLPGGIDVHTHLDMPFGGTMTADDFFTGHRGAAFGGTTTHIDFALQPKDGTLKDAIKQWHGKADEKAVIDYGFHAAVTSPNEEMIAEIPQLIDEGVTSLKIFMAYKGLFMADDTTMFRSLQQAKKAGMLIMTHAENGDMVDILTKQLVAAGKTEPKYHLDAHPAYVEGSASARAIAIAGVADAPLYIVHMSCEESIEQLRIGRKRGIPVMGETCTQYMFKFEDDMRVPGFEGAKWACGPPVRKPKDAEYIWRSLADSTLQAVSTDHCSFWYEGGKDGRNGGKELGKEGFHKIPNGIPGIEDRLYVMWHNGVNSGTITPSRFVEITSTNPAKIFGMYPKKGTISVGSDADIVVWDPEKEHTVSAETHHINTDYNAYEGMKVKGMPVRTIIRGRTVVADGELKVDKGSGKFIRREPFGEVL